MHLPDGARDASRVTSRSTRIMSSRTRSTSSSGAALRALSDDLAGAVERAARSVVAIHARPRIPASGVYWRDGIIVATSHTIRRESDIAVTLPDGSRARARLTGRDGGTDLALLRLDGTPGDALALPGRAPDDTLRVGSLVLAVGRPGGGADGVSASLGVVSTVGERWRTWSGGEIDRFVRLDLAIYDGFSGGALVDAEGRVAGINSSALARGAPLTIPIATVDRVVDALATRGHVARAYLGVAMQPVALTPAMAKRHGLTASGEDGARGVLVVMVEGDSPADRAGLLIGDVIVAADGQDVAEPQDVAELLGADRVGSALELAIVRGGERRTLVITVGERPAESVSRRGRGA
jgi:S1-C subfamily serine protease